MRIETQFLFIVLLGIILVSSTALSKDPQKSASDKKQSLQKASGLPRYSLLNINNLTTWQRSDGQSNHSPTGNDGMFYPRGTANVVYQDCFVWGGKAYTDVGLLQPAPDQLVRVGGGSYTIGTREGWIVGNGADAIAADPSLDEVRIYRIRRDYASMNQEELVRDAATYFEIPESEVTGSHIDQIITWYAKDWSEWPVHRGAPFIDRNGNGVYDPPPPFDATFTVDSLTAQNRDEPGIAGSNLNIPADQVVWTAYNDINSIQSVVFSGSLPLGLELQVTMWAYKRTDALGEGYFKRLRMINKGGVDVGGGSKGSFFIDSMFVGQWSDIDLGAFSDDLVGVDSARALGYVYNANALDQGFAGFGLPPPSVGYQMLGGAMVPWPGDSAIFDLKRVHNMKNIIVTSFAHLSAGSGYTDPPGGNYPNGTGRWWKMLRGFAPLGSITDADQFYASGPFPPSKFPLSGDPVSETGWIDGLGQAHSVAPGDRRFLMSSGPFYLAPGDTQEVTMAVVGGMGADRLSSISVMKTNVSKFRGLYNVLLSFPADPNISVGVSFPSQSTVEVKVTANATDADADSISVTLHRYSDSFQIGEFSLFDDGLHEDGLAGDGVFSNSLDFDRVQDGLFLNARVLGKDGVSRTIFHAVDNITTAGHFTFTNPVIFSDNLNNNGLVNLGENIRFGFTLRNETPFTYSVQSITTPMDPYTGRPLQVNMNLGPEQEFTPTYSPTNQSTYLEFDVPPLFPEENITIPVVLQIGYNRWEGLIELEVIPGQLVFERAGLAHVQGKADGHFEISVIDPLAVLNHNYRITGVDSINAERERGFTLRNLTTNTILLENHPLPDSLGHLVPITEGFKVLRGTIPDQSKAGMKSLDSFDTPDSSLWGWKVPSGQRVWTWSNGNGLGLEGFRGAIGWNEPASYYGGFTKTLKPTDLKKTLVRFAATDTEGNVLNSADVNWSYAYRYGRGFAGAPAQPGFAPFIVNPSSGYSYQDYTKSIPFSAWDVESDPPRRLSVGFLENNVVGGRVDGKYWPPTVAEGDNTTASGPREWFFIFNVDYSETPASQLMTDILSNNVPIMWWGTPGRRVAQLSSDDEFLIIPLYVVSSNDRWEFNPTIIVGVSEDPVPASFSLSQNYPNPFNPSTKIEFTLPHRKKVTLKIYNLLGQEVVTLVDEILDGGRHVLEWKTDDAKNKSISTGVYFYRIVTGSFVQTKKMVVLR